MTSPHPRRGERPPRKKACQSCTKSKVRCDLERPACSRCRSLGRPCEYPTRTVPTSQVSRPPTEFYTVPTNPTSPEPEPPIFGAAQLNPEMPIPLPSFSSPSWTPRQPRRQVISACEETHELDFTFIDLVPSGDAAGIRDRWLRPYILPPLGQDEVPKVYHPFTLQYISRILTTYPRGMLRDGDVPPIIHRLQVVGRRMPRALANCYSLVRMWEQAAAGSEALVVETVEKEMDRLANETPSTLGDFDLLATFQAYLIYSIMLYFSPLPGGPTVTDKIMITLMEIASSTARNGIFCTAEISHDRPSWESWIVAAAKRRAIFTMYLFCSVYNADNLLPNFIADEMTGVFAPEGKALWEASTRETWEKEYDRHLLNWEDGMLEISELWRSAETGTPRRPERIERWLKTVDEFGMMMFGVTAHVHGC
ncbi:Zn(II)2Cys6 transcription factor domain-containing protein [Aspergillus ibericus CBS 121593]|uniref:Zn(2)-C6 fungal-type domain-containing protein n=1 Tax=Aspergillus ibericus CBS 121593 TaxID=1448316 RepID=A0A395GNN9_9EURO|nr:hypothetical protein BO80DRAFT_468153 [Aspergillus ibericus CBS 121593]RAK96936.1 hypothetical protein BO80DRAFT_468153 [Aspergillus ibericus CBS 121593]